MRWPPAKIGTLICGEKVQAREPPLNKPDSCVLSVPKLPVSEMAGRNAARAAPICALAAMS